MKARADEIPPRRQKLQQDIQAMLREISKRKEKGATMDELKADVLLVSERKDMFRNLIGGAYETPLDVVPEDKKTIRTIFNRLKGSRWRRKFGWVGQPKTAQQPEVSICESECSIYDGLKTRKLWSTDEEAFVTVIGLEMNANGCEGPFPEEICYFAQMKLIKMSNNLIEGHLPPMLQRLEFLEEVDLSGNKMTGPIDEECFAGLLYLKTVNLSFNAFVGSIPDCWAECHMLQSLNLAGNKFTGSIPVSLGNHPNLENLLLWSNDLSGPIPDIFEGAAKLRRLNLSNNRFTGGLYPLRHCTALTDLQLQRNMLDEPIPSTVGDLTNLKILMLQYNEITGKIPRELCNCIHMDMFNASYNMLVGRIPKNIGDMSHMRVLKLTGNNLRGPVPISIARLLNLKDFHIFAPFPSDDCEPARGFIEREFDRVYRWGTAAGIDHIHWVPEELYGDGGRSHYDVFGEPVFESAPESSEEERERNVPPETGLVGPQLRELSIDGSLGIEMSQSLATLPTIGAEPSLEVGPWPTRLEENSVFTESSGKEAGEQNIIASQRAAATSKPVVAEVSSSLSRSFYSSVDTPEIFE
jgi:hypothetical protein